MSTKQIKLGSLFAGIGGIELGFAQAGVETRWAVEVDGKSCDTYRNNFNHNLIEADVREVNPYRLDSVDVLSAGFPCQAFSIAGKQFGFNDKRGNIFFEIIRFVRGVRPKVIFLENVRNLISHDKGDTFKTIRECIAKEGYFFEYAVLNTMDYSDVPQNRERVYIVCFKKDLKNLYNFKWAERVKLKTKVGDLLDKKVSEDFYYNKYSMFPILEKEITERDTVYQWRRVYVRANKNNVCPTLTANMGTGGHNVPLIIDDQGIRKLTPRECARFQGFPESFKLEGVANSHLYKQIGNSVTVPVITNIAKQIVIALKDAYTRPIN